MLIPKNSKALTSPQAYREYLAQRDPKNRTKGYDIKAQSDTAEIYIYDVIDPYWGVNAEQFVRDVAGITEQTIIVRLNTPGGFVSDGIAIYNALRRHAAKIITVVDGEAASMGSIIALAGDEVQMADNALMMIHNPWGGVLGTSEEMRKAADVLDKMKGQMVDIYTSKTGQTVEQVQSWMDTETWFDAAEAKELGFIDRVLDMKPETTAKKGSSNTDFNARQAQAKLRLNIALLNTV